MKTHKETIEAARRLVEEKPELYQALADSGTGETLTPEEQAMLDVLDADISAQPSKLRDLPRLLREIGWYDGEFED